ncbi:phage integrase family protein [Pseudomonas amygdali pv. aesculi str. 0893_23]|uniref:tyrosine-type recombinase/integrase n=1 Tax=Pseudomonas syringae group genomosp. 2 TaxID=251698 RepID=UPI0001CC43D8|nr:MULTISPECIES: integrase arm-type DNA-binding domain-containing protein [Pseudomonas syringae group genomosp. 2]EGH03598.1 phage integrase family protein [Pseudomonas amygdali pv. aesculi str. 0893_23]KPW22510.1 Phage integrase family protein [Pseudomonas amygdali pv. aesculi]MCQ3009059.1 tyrosine-type recombinase/integrase [Pseudomonas savastanoi]
MLTDAHCRSAKPREKLYRLNDQRGLYLEVKPTGVKAWRYRFALNGKSSMIGLGDYPAVRLSEARERSEAARKLVKEGVNPAQQRQLDRARQANEATNTFDVIAKEWLQTKDWEDITKKRRLDMLERVVFPNIGKLPVREVTSAQILSILQSTFKRGAPSVAAEARRTMSGVFEYAVATLRADSDPVWPVRKALPTNKTQHKTALTTDQIGKLLRDFDNHRCSFQLNYCIQLMWWTLGRPSEVAEAEWEEFDLEAAIWRVPSRRMKARKEHIVPLPRQAIQTLKVLQGITGNRTHLFPGRDNRQMPMAVASMRQALKVLGWSGKYSPHGTRTTGSTRLNELGYRPDAIEAQLAHADQNNVRRAYNHATYFDERRSMMQDWADHLDVWRKE